MKILLEARDLAQYIGARELFTCPKLAIYEGDHIGLIGPNGSGKTTLMEILRGSRAADEGMVRRYASIACVEQFQATQEGEADPRLLATFGVLGKQAGARSGGEDTRVQLAQALGGGGVLLMADEPTAHLDAPGIERFCQELAEFTTYLIISHDRALLDRLCDTIWAMEDGTIHIYEGNYSFYEEVRAQRQARAWQEYEAYRTEKARLEASLARQAQRADSIKKARKGMGNSEARLHRREATEKAEKIHNTQNALASRLERLETVEKPREEVSIVMDFSRTQPPENRVILEAEGLTYGYGGEPVLRDVHFAIPRGSKTALWGPNGAGKTTLLRAIRQGVPGIRVVPKARLGCLYQGFDNVDMERTVLENTMRESVQSQSTARTILARLLFRGDDVRKKAAVLSGGERIKLSLAMLLVSSANVLLLDEPTNFLDMPSIRVMQELLCEYPGTVLFVSHDRSFVEGVANHLLVFDGGAVRPYGGGLRDYEASAGKAEESQRDLEADRLRMRMAQVLERMRQTSQKEALEEEYSRLAAALRALMM